MNEEGQLRLMDGNWTCPGDYSRVCTDVEF